eukprot:TRINITY_DN2285_c0_g1_i4.p1 TRINITY_DN2285_c0_g1~~TRINITY_DN2285_c0_g1_i4.p1  ORF type:complete len:211 (-),score=49.60 TRINITY_DN2285_c0_g1_i4:85-633(-)
MTENFTIKCADIDEKKVNAGFQDRSRADPQLLTLAIAQAKAEKILSELPDDEPESLLITSDQVAFFDGIIREKPESPEECRGFLADYQREPVRACATVVVTNTRTRASAHGSAFASQLFHPIPPQIVEDLIANGEIMSCCGGFIVSLPMIEPYLSVREGTQDELMGFPKQLTRELLQQVDAL